MMSAFMRVLGRVCFYCCIRVKNKSQKQLITYLYTGKGVGEHASLMAVDLKIW